MLIAPSPLLRLVLNGPSPVCSQCARRILRDGTRRKSRNLSIFPAKQQTASLQKDQRYFLSNGFRDGSFTNTAGLSKAWLVSEKSDTSTSQRLSSTEEGQGGKEGAVRAKRRRTAASLNASETGDGSLPQLPLDASSTLSAYAGSAPPLSLRRRLAAYLALTKPRLAFLIVLTTTASYSIYPVPSLLSASATHAPSLSTLTLLFLTTGTFSTIASANTLNMLFEPAYDAQMSRTRNRPLVRGLVSTRSAIMFAIGTGVLGTSILWWGVNPTTAVLGCSNIALYAFVYTPLKRISVVNTWAGAVVGAVPPLMGWTAAGGQYASSPNAAASGGTESTIAALGSEFRELLLSPESTGGWLLAALLFAWQFPHFNALSYPIRHEYFNAGYKMCVSLYPALNARVALRYSALMFPICIGLSYVGVTDQAFTLTSSIANAWMLREAWRFWRTGGGEGPAPAKAARGLFWASVWHLPIVLVLAMAHKKGLWENLWRAVAGEVDEEDWEEE